MTIMPTKLRVDHNGVPAVLQQSSVPGYLNLWAQRDEDAPTRMMSDSSGNRRPIKLAFETMIPYSQAQKRWPEAFVGIELRDTSD